MICGSGSGYDAQVGEEVRRLEWDWSIMRDGYLRFNMRGQRWDYLIA